MCLSPITIVNPSKYVNIHTRNRYLLQVPCGYCAQCQTNKSNEWYYRTFYESLKSWENGSYVYFTTLTYRNKDLPHLSDYMSLPPSLDYPCFNHKHMRNFIQALKLRLKRKYQSDCTFFYSSEYGTDPNRTHRPHYHLILFPVGSVTPLQLSSLISELWKYGRTDDYPYRTVNYIMSHNVISSGQLANSLCACRYVSKYVMKSSAFSRVVDDRVNRVIDDVANKMPDGWKSSLNCKKYRQRLNSLVKEKHRQSTQFGALALRDIDVNNLMDNGYLVMPDYQKVALKIPLPMYYKRKLFFDVVEIRGCKTWIPNADGKRYNAIREISNLKSTYNRLKCLGLQSNLSNSVNYYQLADYVVNIRGRLIGSQVMTTDEVAIKSTHYNYVTPSDKEHGLNGIFLNFRGNNTIGYMLDRGKDIPLSRSKFISRYVRLNSKYERIIDTLYHSVVELNVGKQSAFDLRQRLNNVYKLLQF